MHLFGVVQAHRTSSNLPEPHHYRDSKVCRVLSHEFGVVLPYQTVSLWCEGCLCTSSGCFKHIEPRRTFPNHIITEIAKCVEFCHMSSGWFDCTEPHYYRDSKVCRVLSHEFGVVRLHRTFSIYIVTGEARCAGCLCTSSGCFKHIEPRRTFPNHIITEIEKCVEFCHMSLG